MKIFNARVHRVLDYATVVILLLTPLVAGLGGIVALLLILLAVVHLVLTLVTRYPFGTTGLISFWLHGLLELVVAVALVSAPFLIGFGPGTPARRAYVALAGLIFLVWLLTDYGAGNAADKRG